MGQEIVSGTALGTCKWSWETLGNHGATSHLFALEDRIENLMLGSAIRPPSFWLGCRNQKKPGKEIITQLPLI